MRIEQSFTWHVDATEDQLLQYGLTLLHQQTGDARALMLLQARNSNAFPTQAVLPVTPPGVPPAAPTEAQIRAAAAMGRWGHQAETPAARPNQPGELPVPMADNGHDSGRWEGGEDDDE